MASLRDFLCQSRISANAKVWPKNSAENGGFLRFWRVPADGAWLRSYKVGCLQVAAEDGLMLVGAGLVQAGAEIKREIKKSIAAASALKGAYFCGF